MIRRVLAVVGITVVTFTVVPIAMAPAAGAAPSVPVSVADLVTSAPFSGTISAQSGTNGCSFSPLTFDGSYPGSTAVGTVTLNVAGCLNFYTSYFSGSFTITTGSARSAAVPLVRNRPWATRVPYLTSLR